MDDHELDCLCQDCEDQRLWLLGLFAAGMMLVTRIAVGG